MARTTSWSTVDSWSGTWWPESSWIGGRIYLRLSLFCDEHRSGYVWPADNGYQCFGHAPKLVRRPDVSFIREDRLPGGELPKGHVPIPPDLAVEVVSPNDLASDLDEKLEDYQRAGVGLVWVIHPESRTLSVYRVTGPGAGSRIRTTSCRART